MTKIINQSDIFVSSSDRDKESSNILSDISYSLDKNPFFLTENQNKMRINIPGHGLEVDDLITIRNASSDVILNDMVMELVPSFIMIDISNYIDYFNLSETFKVEFITYEEYLLGSISVRSITNKIYQKNLLDDNFLVIYLNDLNSYENSVKSFKIRFNNGDIEDNFKCSLVSVSLSIDIEKYLDVFYNKISYEISVISQDEFLFDNFKKSKIDNTRHEIKLLNKKFLIINTGLLVLSNNKNSASHRVRIEFLDTGGVPINEINAYFPIDKKKNINGYHEVIDVDRDNIYISLNPNLKITSVSRFGGNNIRLSKIESQVIGYKNNNEYLINLFKTFYNVVSLEIKSSFFPKTIKSVSPFYDNQTFEWMDSDDNRYSLTLKEYNYSLELLLSEIVSLINTTPISSSSSNSYFYSKYKMIGLYFFELSFYSISSLNEPFEISSLNLESNYTLNRINVVFPNHNLKENITIEIQNSLSFRGIPSEVLNARHFITIVDKDNFFFNISRFNINKSSLNENNKGGIGVKFLFPLNVKIQKNNLSDLLQLNQELSEKKENTIPVRLYKNCFYINTTINNGDININNYTKNGLSNILSKVCINQELVDLVNCHSNNQLLFNPPLVSLYNLKVDFKYEDNTIVDFFNMDHDFILTVKYIDYI